MHAHEDPSTDNLYPLALLIDELKDDDVSTRLQAMHRVSTIALALGKHRTRDELIPFLEEVTQDDEDEVLASLAEELGDFVAYIGGVEHLELLLPALEALACVEEPVVRDKAVASINKLAALASDEQIAKSFVSLIKRLSSQEWFSSRLSATALSACVVSRISEEHLTELLAIYKALCSDEFPMVRRAAASNVPKLVESLPSPVTFEGDLQAMFKASLTDDQDSVRLLSVDVLIAIAQALKTAHVTKYNDELTSYAISLFTDNSWRVRYMAANRFEQLARALDSVDARDKFVGYFVKLMKDSEAEVRTVIGKQVPGFCSLVSSAVILDKIIPNVELLAQDSSQYVRAALASQISRLAPLLGKQDTTNYLLPTFLQMLKDDYPDVRLNIISKLQIVNEVIGIDLLSKSVLPAVSELAKDKQWRVRLAIIEYIPVLAEQLGVSFFDKELSPLCMTWLWDSVYSIRRAATINLKKLVLVFGVKWAQKEIIPRIIFGGTNSSYLYRLTALQALTTLMPAVSSEVIITNILPMFLDLMADPIPNIRFNVAKSLRVLVEAYLTPDVIAEREQKDELQQQADANDTGHSDIPPQPFASISTEYGGATSDSTPKAVQGPQENPETLLKLIEQSVLSKLHILAKDDDVDVKFFANQSIELVNQLVKQHLSGQ